MSGTDRPRLIVGTADIRHRLGTRKPVLGRVRAEGITLTDVEVPDGEEISLDGEVESISEGVVVTGEVAVPWTGSCRRCLDDVAGVATSQIREIFERDHSEGETWPMHGDDIDLGPLLHDTALLILPLAPLCGEDCRGPAPEEFPTGEASDEEDDAVEPPRDPRWAALDALDFD